LLYLACVELEKDMSQDERLLRAHDLALSAFLAETIYNFGELVCCSADWSPELRLSLWRFNVLDWCCVANAPHLGLVGWYSSRMDQEASLHIQ
jgi:hypothetical protein